MKSKYKTIIQAILKSEGINADADEVQQKLESESLDPLDDWPMHVFIHECKLSGRKLSDKGGVSYHKENKKRTARNRRVSNRLAQ